MIRDWILESRSGSVISRSRHHHIGKTWQHLRVAELKTKGRLLSIATLGTPLQRSCLPLLLALRLSQQHLYSPDNLSAKDINELNPLLKNPSIHHSFNLQSANNNEEDRLARGPARLRNKRLSILRPISKENGYGLYDQLPTKTWIPFSRRSAKDSPKIC